MPTRQTKFRGQYIYLAFVLGFLAGFRGLNILPGLPSKVSISPAEKKSAGAGSPAG
jgi:hypothetical protein